jgi:hypothetical protein
LGKDLMDCGGAENIKMLKNENFHMKDEKKA